MDPCPCLGEGHAGLPQGGGQERLPGAGTAVLPGGTAAPVAGQLCEHSSFNRVINIKSKIKIMDGQEDVSGREEDAMPEESRRTCTTQYVAIA